MLMAVMRVMILCRDGERNVVMFFGSKSNLLAAGPGRSNAGEEDQEATSDEDQSLHMPA
jgi:hypothetical protein